MGLFKQKRKVKQKINNNLTRRVDYYFAIFYLIFFVVVPNYFLQQHGLFFKSSCWKINSFICPLSHAAFQNCHFSLLFPPKIPRKHISNEADGSGGNKGKLAV